MLNFSLSSVIMAVLTSNLLIVILSVIFLNRSILYKFGLPLLGIFGVLITLRMLMPFEFNNITKNICLPERFSKAIVFYMPSTYTNTILWKNNFNMAYFYSSMDNWIFNTTIPLYLY